MQPTHEVTVAQAAAGEQARGQRTLESAAPEPHLRVDVHDRSRVEWVATVPLARAGESHSWLVDMEAEIPDAMWVPHQPWDHFVVRTRLTSPVLQPGQKLTGPPIEQLRRRALAATHELKESLRAPLEVLRLAWRRDRTLRADEAAEVVQRVRTALDRLAAARDACAELRVPEHAALERELRLVDEYLSQQVFLVVTRLTSALAGPKRKGKHRPLLGEVAPVRQAMAVILAAEQTHRQQGGLGEFHPRESHDVEAFLNRGAMLKKHFQQALFLDAKAYMLDARLRNWIAMAAAMAASTFYFVLQVWILNAAMAAGQTLTSLAVACVIAGVVYAGKDRIKDIGKDWVASKLKHGIADRVAHLSLQSRIDSHHSAFALARETIRVHKRLEPDRLNPELGRTTAVHRLHVREVLKHTGQQLLHDEGLLGMKHVFRYDLSPLFHKLDDHIKHVPVLGRDGEVHSLPGTRVYSVPVRVRMKRIAGGPPVELEERGVLVVRRRGLERFVRGAEARRLVREHGLAGHRTPQPALAVVPGVALHGKEA